MVIGNWIPLKGCENVKHPLGSKNRIPANSPGVPIPNNDFSTPNMSTGTVDIQQYQCSDVNGIFNSKHLPFPAHTPTGWFTKNFSIIFSEQDYKGLFFYLLSVERQTQRKDGELFGFIAIV